jgi:predicted LPLAT superfamily acyltransferase
VLEREEVRLREMLGEALQDRQFKLLATDGHPLRSIPIAAALKRGEIVALQGDRSFGGQDVTVRFLGGNVRFPVGAYLLAAATGAPIFQVFVVREKLTRYRFVSSPPQFVGRELLRQPVEALRGFVEQYAERLASMARQYPFQWYNFYPFWESEQACPAPGHSAAAKP